MKPPERRRLLASTRWSRHASFVNKWALPSFSERSGASRGEVDRLELEVGRPLPAALREWYSIGGRYWSERAGFALEDWLAPGPGTALEAAPADHLPVLVEAQGLGACALALRDFTLDDPPVYLRPGHPIADSLSEFQLALLFNHRLEYPEDWDALAASGVRFACLTARGLCRRFERAYATIPVRAWNPWLVHHPRYPVRFVGDGDTLVRLEGDEDAVLVARAGGAVRVLEVAGSARPVPLDDYLHALNETEARS